MKKVLVFIADGSEEIEALTPVDVLRRAGVEVKLVSVNGKQVTGSHDVLITADEVIENFSSQGFDGVVIPGGMPGAVNISNSERAIEIIKNLLREKKVVASICASPAVVLGSHGLIDGVKATCYPAPQFIDVLGKDYTGTPVQVSENVITANGPKSAMEFSIEICKALGVSPKF